VVSRTTEAYPTIEASALWLHNDYSRGPVLAVRGLFKPRVATQSASCPSPVGRPFESSTRRRRLPAWFMGAAQLDVVTAYACLSRVPSRVLAHGKSGRASRRVEKSPNRNSGGVSLTASGTAWSVEDTVIRPSMQIKGMVIESWRRQWGGNPRRRA